MSRFTQRIVNQLSESGESSDFEFRYVHPDGRTVHLAVIISIIRDNEKKRGLVVFLRDVSKQMRLLRDMAQGQKMAALESMAGAVAHHFNNILGGAVTTADFALASDDPDLHKRTLGITITALSRASELTRGLLAFAEGERTETGTADITQAIEQQLSRLESTLKARNVQLQTSLQPLHVSVPAKALGTVLDRLINNALESMPNGGTLTVELQPGQNGGAVLRIADSGPGISEQSLPRIFEPFFTTKQPNRNRPGEHPGLGLAVVHGIIKDLRGTITVTGTSESGMGTIVYRPTAWQPHPQLIVSSFHKRI